MDSCQRDYLVIGGKSTIKQITIGDIQFASNNHDEDECFVCNLAGKHDTSRFTKNE